MKIEQLIEDLESQIRRLKAMKLEGEVDVNFAVTDDDDSFGGDVLAVSDIEILFFKWRDNSILVGVNYERESY